MDSKAVTDSWIELGEKIDTLAKKLFSEADLTKSNLGTADPKLIAVALLCRTIGHFQCAIGLAQQGFIVEARVLTRCCYENLIWMDGLAAKGTAFVKEITGHDIASRQKRGKDILEWAAKQPSKPAYAEALEAHLTKLAADYDKIKDKENPKDKPKMINFKTTAAAGVLKDSYIIYGQLSSDAAHPSAESLSRHTVRNKVSDDETEITILGDPKVRADELNQTLEFACGAYVGVCVGMNQILGGLPSGPALAALFDQFDVLRKHGAKQIAPGQQD